MQGDLPLHVISDRSEQRDSEVGSDLGQFQVLLDKSSLEVTLDNDCAAVYGGS